MLGALSTKVFGRRTIEIHDCIDSTNSRLKELALAGAEEGSLVAAETQTQGRGRLGRTWHSPPLYNLYFSLLLTELPPVESRPLVTLVAGLAAAEAVLMLTGRRPGLKWPNDLLLDGRKIAGLLAELDSSKAGREFVVLGVGLNVNLDYENLPPELKDQAGSLFMATGRRWDRIEVLAALLWHLENDLTALKEGRIDGLLRRYRTFCQTLGARVEIAQGADRIRGLAVEVDDCGRLVIECSDTGRLIQVNAGEVTLIKGRP
ncbi:MAG: biotin--[acetyl-CoA-carboxylase] ligase [Pseudomonadota bacterium]